MRSDIAPPEEKCTDANCPFHGKLSIRGRVFEGMVVGNKMQKTVTVEIPRVRKVPKYERYLKSTSKLHAHNPPCIAAKAGDRVKIAECRRLSKTKSFVVLQKLGR